MKTPYLTRKLTTLRNFRSICLATGLAVALATMFLAASHSKAQGIQHGYLVVPVGQQTIYVYNPESAPGTPPQIFPHTTPSTFTGDAMVLPNHSPLLALFDGNSVARFTSMGVPDGNFGNVPYDSQPNSFACFGNPYVYVGQEAGTGDVLQFDALGNFITRYNPLTVARGTAWIDVTPPDVTNPDPVLWYVTGPGMIKRYNMSAGTQMPDYGVGLINHPEEFKVIPIGVPEETTPDFRGQVIVADPPVLKRLSGADGTFLEQTYGSADQVYPTAVAIDPDGDSVWTADRTTASVIEYNLISGAPVTSIPTGQFGEVSGLGIDGERTVCGGAAPPTAGGRSRMTGGGSVFTAIGVRVTHGFTLRCDVLEKPHRMMVSWPDNRFKLTAVTAVSCTDDPALTPSPKRNGFDTQDGMGTGELNGVPGATISWTFTDAGEPGTADRCRIEITQLGIPVLVVDGPLQNGNHQAHK